MTELTLILLLFFYSTFSTPWPQSIGIGEIMVFLFIVIFFARQLPRCLSLELPLFRKFFLVTVCFCFLSLAWCSLIGVFNPLFNFRDYMRDAIPSLFVLLFPLSSSITYVVLITQKYSLRNILLFSALLGSILCVRGLQETGFDISMLGISGFYDDQTYKQYDPIVLFSAFSSCSLGLLYFSELKYFKSIFCFVFFFVMLTAFSSVVLRQPIAFSILSPLSIISVSKSFQFLRRLMIPKKLFFSIVLLFVVAFIAVYEWGSYLTGLADSLLLQIYQKTESYGISAKSNELIDVMTIANNSLGTGFGAPYYNSANGFYATFTHSVLTYPLLKGGYVNAILTFSYIFYIVWEFRRVFSTAFKAYWRYPVLRLMLASFAMLIFVSFFQVVYKPLTFSIVCGFALGAIAYICDAVVDSRGSSLV